MKTDTKLILDIHVYTNPSIEYIYDVKIIFGVWDFFFHRGFSLIDSTSIILKQEIGMHLSPSNT